VLSLSVLLSLCRCAFVVLFSFKIGLKEIFSKSGTHNTQIAVEVEEGLNEKVGDIELIRCNEG